MWVFGHFRDYDVWRSSDGISWTEVTDSADWAPGYGYGMLVNDGRLWQIGNEVWSSPDGLNWDQRAYANPWWTKRAGHASVFFDDRVWVLGGGARSDVWSSPDGEHWTVATYDASWVDRMDHAAAVYDGRIWVLGGRYYWNEEYNDVWYSSDGRHWTAATRDAPWEPRYRLSAFSYAGKLWMHGGVTQAGMFGATWTTEDGTSWTQVGLGYGYNAAAVHKGTVFLVGKTSEYIGLNLYETGFVVAFNEAGRYEITTNPPWVAREGHALVSARGRLWLIGGLARSYSGEGFALRDVWSSPDGRDWQLESGPAPFPARWAHTAVATRDRIVVMGGGQYALGSSPVYPLNDIWYTELYPRAAARNWEGYP